MSVGITASGRNGRGARTQMAILLPTLQHRKLATVLSGKPQLLESVVERSGLQRRECEIFLKGLLRLELLEVTAAPVARVAFSAITPMGAPPQGESPVHWRASLGLVARIRNRLGLPSSAPSA